MSNLTEVVDRQIESEHELLNKIRKAALWHKRTMTPGESMQWFTKVTNAGFTDFNGCSFSPDMVFRWACNIHDAMWSLEPVHKHEADRILRLNIQSMGVSTANNNTLLKKINAIVKFAKYYLIGWFYWAVVRFVWLGGLYKFGAESYRHIKRFFWG